MLESIKNIFKSSDRAKDRKRDIEFINMLSAIEPVTDVKIERVRQSWYYSARDQKGLYFAKKIDDKSLNDNIVIGNRVAQFNSCMDIPAVKAYLEKLMALYLIDDEEHTPEGYIDALQKIGIKVKKMHFDYMYYTKENIENMFKIALKQVKEDQSKIKNAVGEIIKSCEKYDHSLNDVEKYFSSLKKGKEDVGGCIELLENRKEYLEQLSENVLNELRTRYKSLGKANESAISRMGGLITQLKSADLTQKDLRKSINAENRSSIVNQITKLLDDEYQKGEQEYINKHKKEFELCVKYSKSPYSKSLKQTLAELRAEKGFESDDLQRAQIGVTVFLGVAIDAENKNYEKALKEISKCFY